MRVLLDAGNPFVSALPASVYRHPLCQSLAPSIPEPCPAAARRLTVHAHVHLFPSTLHLYGLPSICPRFAEDSWPQPTEKKLEIFKAMGRVGSLRSQKYVQTFSKNTLKIVPKCSPKPPKIDPQTLQNGSPNRIRKKTPILMPKGLPNGAPRAPQRLPFGVIFRTIFWTTPEPGELCTQTVRTQSMPRRAWSN